MNCVEKELLDSEVFEREKASFQNLIDRTLSSMPDSEDYAKNFDPNWLRLIMGQSLMTFSYMAQNDVYFGNFTCHQLFDILVYCPAPFMASFVALTKLNWQYVDHLVSLWADELQRLLPSYTISYDEHLNLSKWALYETIIELVRYHLRCFSDNLDLLSSAVEETRLVFDPIEKFIYRESHGPWVKLFNAKQPVIYLFTYSYRQHLKSLQMKLQQKDAQARARQTQNYAKLLRKYREFKQKDKASWTSEEKDIHQLYMLYIGVFERGDLGVMSILDKVAGKIRVLNA